MGHEGGVLDERLNTSQTLSKSEDVQVLEHSFSVLESTLHIEGNHRARSLALLLDNVVLWVAWQTRVDDALNLGVALKELGDGHGVLHGLVDANLQRLARAHGEPRVKRIQASAHGLEHEVELVVELAVINADASGNQVRVTTNVLGDGVSDHVGAEEKWVLVDWGHEGVVDNEKCAMTLASLSNLLDIENLQSRVGGRLKPDHLGVGT